MEQTREVSVQEEVLAFLMSSPTPARIIDFHVSEAAQGRLRYLLEVNRDGTITPAERAELDEASQINHFMTLLKAKSYQVLQAA